MSSPLRIVVIGHVDHGKSTLIGRLLHDTNSLPENKKMELEKLAQKRGLPNVEWSFVLDSFQVERNQNVTIDTTQVRFRTAKRDYILIDAPGHQEFLKNMIAGASLADAALIVIDVNEGLQEQTRRHAYLAYLLGLRQVIVVLNKMDIAGYDAHKFMAVKSDIEHYLASLNIIPIHIIPIAARHGEMIAERSAHMDWYQGPVLTTSFDDILSSLTLTGKPLRFPIQDVYKFENERVLVGHIESGVINKGDVLHFSPGMQQARVTAIKVWPDHPDKIEASAGESIGITLDQRIFIERGDMASHAENPPLLTQTFKVRMIWLSPKPLQAGDVYKMRHTMQESQVTIQAIEHIISIDDLSEVTGVQTVMSGQIVELTIRAHDIMAIDPHGDHGNLGRIVLYREGEVVGGGIILPQELIDLRHNLKASHLQSVDHLVSYERRSVKAGYKGQVFWLTGLSGSGKSTLAMRVEKNLFDRGYQVYVLDGDNVRQGLCADLGFSEEDRRENIRRVGEVASLMADAGMIVISAFISPFAEDRLRARKAAKHGFHEIYMNADLKACESRDPKGLYAKARAGEIREFTGIDSPYEKPEAPELVVDTVQQDIEYCVKQIIEYIESTVALKTSQEKARAF